MGSSSSFLESVKSSKISNYIDYFDNSALLKGFYTEAAKQSSSETLSLNGVLRFLANDNVGNTVALYASPFLGPMATSSSCLRQAYITMSTYNNTPELASNASTSVKQDTDLKMISILDEKEFKLFLKHLLFHHILYELFADESFKVDFLNKEKLREYIEDIVDDDTDQNTLNGLVDAVYADLPRKNDFSCLVSWSVSKLLGSESFLSLKQKVQRRKPRLGKSFSV